MEKMIKNLEKMVESRKPCAESELRKHLSVYKVPSFVEALNPDAYKPHAFSFGPAFYKSYDQSHKQQALFFFLKRAGKCVRELVAALEDLVYQVIDAYDPPLRRLSGIDAYLEMMLLDGCFMLEILRAAAGKVPEEYPENDPIFSAHGMFHVVPTMKRDMMVLENQLPLVVLERLVAIENGQSENEKYINELVMNFYGIRPGSAATTILGLGVHVLDVFRKGSFQVPEKKTGANYSPSLHPFISNAARGASGYSPYSFRKSRSANLNAITGNSVSISLPQLIIDDNTETVFLNLLAFERLHVGAGNSVGSYIAFMASVISSDEDAYCLLGFRILVNNMRSPDAIASMFQRLSKGVVIEPDSYLREVLSGVNLN